MLMLCHPHHSIGVVSSNSPSISLLYDLPVPAADELWTTPSPSSCFLECLTFYNLTVSLTFGAEITRQSICQYSQWIETSYESFLIICLSLYLCVICNDLLSLITRKRFWFQGMRYIYEKIWLQIMMNWWRWCSWHPHPWWSESCSLVDEMLCKNIDLLRTKMRLRCGRKK